MLISLRGFNISIDSYLIKTMSTGPIRSCVRGRTQFSKILGFAGKRFLLSPPPSLSFLFLLLSQLSQRTHAETLYMQARMFVVKIYYIRSRRPLGTYSYWTSSRSIWIACPWLDRKKFFWPISEEEQLGVSGVLLHDVVSLINHHSWVWCSKGESLLRKASQQKYYVWEAGKIASFSMATRNNNLRWIFKVDLSKVW